MWVEPVCTHAVGRQARSARIPCEHRVFGTASLHSQRNRCSKQPTNHTCTPAHLHALAVRCLTPTQVRFEVLAAGKTLLTPQPRLRTGFFSTLTAACYPANAVMEACTSGGVAKYGQPLSLSESAGLKVDMIVVGSSAVSRNGARLGKGEVSGGERGMSGPTALSL